MMLDDRGVHALGKVSELRKLAELAGLGAVRALLGGESFGMILTEAFAASTPVVASDIPGYRDVVRDGLDGQLVPAGDALALAEALRRLALDPPAAVAWRSQHGSAPSASPGRTSPPKYSTAMKRPARISSPATRIGRAAVRHGLRARRPASAHPRAAPCEPAERRRPGARAPPPAHASPRRAADELAGGCGTRRTGLSARRRRPVSSPRSSPPSPACSPPASA